jgi:hypothetical protein
MGLIPKNTNCAYILEIEGMVLIKKHFKLIIVLDILMQFLRL